MFYNSPTLYPGLNKYGVLTLYGREAFFHPVPASHKSYFQFSVLLRSSKTCGQPLKNFTWSTLEYFLPNGFWFWCNQVNSVYLCSEEVIKGIKHISLFEILFFKLFQLFTNPCENYESSEGPCILRIIYENSLYSFSHLQKKQSIKTAIKLFKKRI